MFNLIYPIAPPSPEGVRFKIRLWNIILVLNNNVALRYKLAEGYKIHKIM